ncbi:lipopolysaccharide biosynthesis protein [Turicibacter sanguinis]|uniref:lipopolysaccharide biosynthesis protein n=1 Tax=Turicibacter sanguinis TaxID=154288 RepID=UPI0018AB0472|nr:capsular biosynthesis protein [Turicibacter sanguinis]MDB8559586.1 hypothetical protein [Turicibacter sanguinis]MDB8561039.1 hypothetical protein [Turicibacter sanguinis]
MNLKHNIVRIFSANFLTMISSIIIGFLIPAILSVENYSLVKTYTFYISYIGFFHLGYIDGMYIKYGGKDIEEINKINYKKEHHIFLIFQCLITLIFIIISFFIKDIIVFLMALSILPINIFSFYKLFYQATGQFKIYANYSYIYTVVYLISNLILALFFRSQNYILYCLTNLFSNLFVFLLLEYMFFKQMHNVKVKLDLKPLVNIKIGIFILIGNLSVVLFYALDRWFIKLFFEINQFGYYSFAISMLNIVNVLVSAISITFYNYLSRDEDEEKIKEIKKYFIILGGFASCGYFLLAGIVNLFLEKYIPALSIISISFAAYPYMIVINALYVNLYKTRKCEKRYVGVVFFMVLISLIYNVIALLLFKTTVAIAMATTLSFVTWYIYSMKDFKYTKINIKEFIYLGSIFILFLYCAHNLHWIIGGIVYILGNLILLNTVYIKEIQKIVKIYFLKRNW